MAKGLNDLITRLNNVQENIGKEVAKSAELIFQDEANDVIKSWYGDYAPTMYHRTYNFIENTIRYAGCYGYHSSLIFYINADNMNDYEDASAEYVFDIAFNKGWHGKRSVHVTTPAPYELLYNKIRNGFNGRINSVLVAAMDKLMK